MKAKTPYRVVARTLGGFGLAIVAYAFVLAFPEPLFSNSVTHSAITFHSQSPLPARAAEVASAVVDRLAASELFEPDATHRGADAINILTHEVVHSLVQDRIGVPRVWRLAWWQREGYPEYIASERGGLSQAPGSYQDAARVWKRFSRFAS